MIAKPSKSPIGQAAALTKFALGAAVAILLVLALPVHAQVALDNEFSAEPSWKIPAAAEVRTAVLGWLNDQKPGEAVRAQVIALWPGTAAETKTAESSQLLERVVTSLALADPAAREVVEFCNQPHPIVKSPEFAILTDQKTPAFVRNNLRLWLGQWLAQQRLYDEAMTQLKDLQPTDVVDPAALLFYQGVCQHWMLQKEEGLKTIAKLLEQKKSIPRRYQEVAELMQSDLSGLEDDSLDHISRRMNDVTRRLDLGNAGKKVRGQEDGIVDSLDKLIKQMEDMANAMGGGGGSGDEQQQQGGGNQGDPQGIKSRNPASDSRLARGKGPGEVKNKNIGNKSGWGDLPPKEREEAMQQISKDFPSHYRDVIEQYFRRLASENEDSDKK